MRRDGEVVTLGSAKPRCAGSIPARASNDLEVICPGGGTGIRTGLKILGQKWIEGSSPSPGTILKHLSTKGVLIFTIRFFLLLVVLTR